LLQRSIIARHERIPALSGVRRVISLARYAALLKTRELRQLFAVSVVGRLPIGITGLPVLILVQTSRGSFAEGGVATGCYVAGLALVAPALERIIDRYGPLAALRASALLFPAALIGLAATVTHPAAGASFPPITAPERRRKG
jgi:MFS family permease